ncbi:leucyl aminopeptidase [Microlunatus flavus]|uniref:Probable cytosol aminopeptidase n=1 Tax=Microlunatus flavus TaxID=1036181 RepID=A0A1H9KKJ8_9ACTN|nr:leucyl aminopeptidase [Microlunatus flavus]SEQ99628.1 leucyl aminopeptidase [Microlunatus flavus]
MPTPPLPSLALATSLPRGSVVLVVGLAEDGVRGVPAAVDAAYAKSFGTDVATLAASVGATSKAGQTRTLPPVGDVRLVVVGLGDQGEDEAAAAVALREAAATGVRYASGLADGADQKGAKAAARARGALSVVVALGTSTPETTLAVATGALVGTYAYAGVGARSSTPPAVEKVTVLHEGAARTAAGEDVAEVANVVAAAVLTAREWVNIPANLLYPASFAEEAQALVKGTRISVEVLDEGELEAQGYGGLMAVGGGSARPPRLVRLSYRPRGAKTHLALVGKGITFDTGGLNLKPGDSMYTMKCDMAGAAAVLAATWAIAKLGLKVQVTAYGALAENMPSGSAYRPSDVITIYGGTTVENGNSDAEGRIVMADALARSNADSPDLVVDVATLTGAAVVALGDRTAGVMATDDATAQRVLEASKAAGEPFWQLPIPPETRGKLDSSVADLRSTGGSDRSGGALVAAAFLREFVDAPTPWAHLDIAGPAFRTGSPEGSFSTGGTGVGVTTLVALARSMAG